MPPTTTVDASADTVETTIDGAGTEDDVLAEVLVEEISIDGMCGVY